MLAIALIIAFVIIFIFSTMMFIFNRIENEYEAKKRKIEHLTKFAKRNNIEPEELALLYEICVE